MKVSRLGSESKQIQSASKKASPRALLLGPTRAKHTLHLWSLSY